MHLKMSYAKWRPFCLGLNVLKCLHISMITSLHSSYLNLNIIERNLQYEINCLKHSAKHLLRTNPLSSIHITDQFLLNDKQL